MPPDSPRNFLVFFISNSRFFLLDLCLIPEANSRLTCSGIDLSKTVRKTFQPINPSKTMSKSEGKMERSGTCYE